MNKRRMVSLAILLLFLAACAAPETPIVTASPSPPPTIQPSASIQISFSADQTALKIGECTTLRWEIQGGFGANLNGQPIEKTGQQQVCLKETTTYILTLDAGSHIEQRDLTINVEGVPPGPPQGGPEFTSPPSSFDPSTLQPFTSGALYLGQYETGLYPGGSNDIPPAHLQAGERIAQTIQPLDTNGAPDAVKGKIIGLIIGHSNTMMYFGQLEALFKEHTGEIQPQVELINAALGGHQLPQIVDPNDSEWNNAAVLLANKGYSEKQVQVLFLHTTYHGCCNNEGRPPGEFPASMQAMQDDLVKVLEHAMQVYANLKIAYLTSDGFRHFTSFEPHVWQEAFAFKWLIESQIEGEAGTEFEGFERRLPWLQWGPYIWDNTWDSTYFTDGVHPAQKALSIFKEKYWQFLSNDRIAQIWLFRSK